MAAEELGSGGDRPPEWGRSSSSTSDSTSSSSSVVAAAQCGGGAQCGSEPMVKIELDAARALADFAQLALMEIESGGRKGVGKEWGNTGRRTRKRFKNGGGNGNDNGGSTESGEGGRGLLDSWGTTPRPFALDLNQNACALEDHLHQGSNEIMEEKNVELPMNSEMLRIGLSCPSTSRLTFGGGRAKQNMSEAEKEARKLRRILANRESARQTIRRRQALHEELMRKADTLSRDNEIMKKEKERMLKEFLLLKDTNRRLKEKMVEKVKLDDEEDPMKNALTKEALESSSTKPSSLVTQRLPSIRFAWPTLVPPLNVLKTHPNSQSTKLGYQEGPFYMSSYQWFHPVLHQHPGSSSAKSCAPVEKCEDHLHTDHDSFGAILFAERGAVDGSSTNENGASTSTGTGSLLGSCSGGSPVFGPRTPINTTRPLFRAKSEPELNLPNKNVAEVSDEEHSRTLKKALEVAAAADARKRRKKLTKMRNTSGGQH